MEIKAYEAIADAFVKEGVDTFFVLMGDGNMHLTSALQDRSVRCIHLRHEHNAVAAATSFATVRGDVGVASVTHGPGFTQTMTALVTAVHARVPLVVFVGETPIKSKWNNQLVEQAPFAAAAGVPYLAIHRPEAALETVYKAFDMARTERRPVVVAMPADLQMAVIAAGSYRSSRQLRPVVSSGEPSAEAIKELAERLSKAQKPVILVGKGVLAANALEDARELADTCGALVATTLLANGALEDHKFSLGVIGGFGTTLSHELGKECDLVIALGAGLNTFTLHGGRMFPNAFVVQVDLAPRGQFQGLPPVDLRIQADCKAAIHALLRELKALDYKPGKWRSDVLANRIATHRQVADPSLIDEGTLDPFVVVEKLSQVLPANWEFISGAGHCAYFLAQMRGRSPGRFTTIRHFGAIGNGLAYAIGVAAAKPDSNIVLGEGDGALLMHIQELECIRRHKLKILICVLNDGGYGSEIHTLRAHGTDPEIAIFGREDFARIMMGFGLNGHNVSDLDTLPKLLGDFQRGDRTTLWNFQISDKVTRDASLRPAH
jgi:acetolactate synthase I/II/III large subunit